MIAGGGAWGQLLEEPLFALEGESLDTLELLLGGLLAPAHGYCLPGSMPEGWPTGSTLRVPADVARQAVEYNALLLTDPDGTPLARLTVDGVGTPTDHIVYLAGPLIALQPAEHPPARPLRLTAPLNRTSMHPASRILAAVFNGQPKAEQTAEAIATAHASGAALLFLAAVESNYARSDNLAELLAVLQRCAAVVPGASVRLLVAPQPETNGSDIRGHALNRLGADIILDFSDEKLAMAPPAGPTFRRQGQVVLFTGLSGSGKSTLARELVQSLRQLDDRPVTLLDGDDVRRMLSARLGFSREDRELNIRRIGWVASLVSKSGGIAVCAPIAPFEATRHEVRKMAENVGGFILIHVSTLLDVCERRDRKGLYAKARAGLIPDFTGIDSPYEIPQAADQVIDTAVVSIEDGVQSVLQQILRS